jgi:hypothetical protein
VLAASGSASYPLKPIEVRNLMVNCFDSRTTNGGGLQLKGAQNSVVDNCYVAYANVVGIQVAGAGDVNTGDAMYCRVERNDVVNLGSGAAHIHIAIAPTVAKVTSTSGTAFTATTATDASLSMTPGAWVGYTLKAGSSTMVITSNTATQVTGSGGWTGGTPANGTVFTVQVPGSHPDGARVIANFCNSSWTNGTIGIKADVPDSVALALPADNVTCIANNFQGVATPFDGCLATTSFIANRYEDTTAGHTLTFNWRVAPLTGNAGPYILDGESYATHGDPTKLIWNDFSSNGATVFIRRGTLPWPQGSATFYNYGTTLNNAYIKQLGGYTSGIPGDGGFVNVEATLILQQSSPGNAALRFTGMSGPNTLQSAFQAAFGLIWGESSGDLALAAAAGKAVRTFQAGASSYTPSVTLDDGAGSVIASTSMRPSGASQPGWWAGTGAPSNGTGSDGDLYARKDGGTGTTIYQRRSGAWVGIV